MQQGGVICVLGAVITICAYAFVPKTGNYYLAAWLSVVAGVFRLGQGLFQYYLRR